MKDFEQKLDGALSSRDENNRKKQQAIQDEFDLKQKQDEERKRKAYEAYERLYQQTDGFVEESGLGERLETAAHRQGGYTGHNRIFKTVLGGEVKHPTGWWEVEYDTYKKCSPSNYKGTEYTVNWSRGDYYYFAKFFVSLDGSVKGRSGSVSKQQWRDNPETLDNLVISGILNADRTYSPPTMQMN